MNDLSDFLEPPSDESGDAKAPETGKPWLVLRAPALNSVELCLDEAMILDPILDRDRFVTFVELDETEPTLPDDDPEIAAVRPAIGDDYLRHIQIARSMGAGHDATWKRYRELCAENGMQPIRHREDKGD